MARPRRAHELLEDRGIRLTRHQMVELYMVTGGVAHYLEKVPRGRSIAQVIDALCFEPDGALVGEFGINRVLVNLEEAGFIQTVIPFGRARRDRFYRLIDEFSLFHLQWIDGQRRGKRGDWTSIRGTAKWNTWAGLAFEALCQKHVDVIERALGITGVRTEASSWQHRARERDGEGAQIDERSEIAGGGDPDGFTGGAGGLPRGISLLIDRADDVISVCELKHTVNPFAITKHYAEALRRKLAVFQHEPRTRKSLQLVLVTTAGVLANAYARDLVDREVGLDAFWS